MSRISITTLVSVAFAAFSLPASAGEDCCAIVSVDQATGVVIAMTNDSSERFEITLDSLKLLRNLEPGMSFSLADEGDSTLFSIVLGSAGAGETLTEDLGADCCDFGGIFDEAAASNQPFTPHSAEAPATPTLELGQGVVLEVTRATRQGSRAVRVDLTVTNDTGKDIEARNYGIATGSLGGGVSFKNLALVDYDAGMKYGVIVDSKGRCSCTSGGYGADRVRAGQKRTFWAQFTAPPGNVDAVTLEFPQAPPVDIRIAD